MSNKTYHAKNNCPDIEATQVLYRYSKVSRSLPQSATDEESATTEQAIYAYAITTDTTSIVGSRRYQPKVTASIQRAKAVLERSNDNKSLQPATQSYSPLNKTYKRIALLGADNETYKYTLEWLKRLRTIVADNKMWWYEPLTNLGIYSEIVFEWWHENKKLTVYILGDTAEYIKVWGTDIDNEMEDGSATSIAEVANLWKWLVS